MDGRTRWLAGAALLLLPLCGLAVAALLLNPDDLRPLLAEAVRAATGRELTLSALRVRLSLWPTVEAVDVRLANLPGGTRPDMARAERIKAELSLPALLWRRIEVDRLTLVGPDILFETVGGQPNWAFGARNTAGTGTARKAPASDPPQAFPAQGAWQLRIRAMHIQNGMATWRLPARTHVVGVRSLDLQRSEDGGPVGLRGTLVYQDNQPFTVAASLQPKAEDAAWASVLELSAPGAAVSARGTLDTGGTYDVQVEARAAALERLNALWSALRLPPARGLVLSAHLVQRRRPGDLPTIQEARLGVEAADLDAVLPGLRLGPAQASLPDGGEAALEGSGSYAGQPFTLECTLGVPPHPDDPAAVPVNLLVRLPAPGGKAERGSIAAKGRLALRALRFAGLDAAMALRAPALASLRPFVPGLPALTDVRLDARVLLPARDGPAILKAAQLSSGQGDVAGEGTVALQSPPTLTARLRSGRLDGDALLQALGISLGPPAPADGPVIPDAPLPWAALRGPALDLEAAVGELRLGGETWREVKGALQLQGGRLRLGPLHVAMPGGAAEVAATADASAPAVPVSLRLRAPAVPLTLLTRRAGLPEPVLGSARIEAQLRGEARSLRELAATLDGPFLFAAVDGRMPNAALIRLASPALDALGIAVPKQGETRLACLGLAGAFTKGVALFRTVALETTYLSLDGVGEVDLGAERMAFQLRPLAQVAGSQVAVPVVVEGPFRAVAARLDATGLDKLGFLLDGLFGGDRPRACADAGLDHRTDR